MRTEKIVGRCVAVALILMTMTAAIASTDSMIPNEREMEKEVQEQVEVNPTYHPQEPSNTARAAADEVLSEKTDVEPAFTNREIEMLAQTVWGEARGLSPDEQRLVAWTVFQRVDATHKWGDNLEDVITQPVQFVGYSENHPVCPVIYALVYEELIKWYNGYDPPTLYPFATSVPYFFFDSDPSTSPVPHNWFREDY